MGSSLGDQSGKTGQVRAWAQRLFSAALLFLLPVASSYAAELVQGIASVIDGDTIELNGERIRLEGIDCPESRQTCETASGEYYMCGQRAAFALADRISLKTVRCESKGRDRYQRLLAVCYIGQEDINAWMVSEGWALAFRKYSTLYIPQEEAAKEAHKGMWQGRFEAPWEWRDKTKTK